jgi:hypothetical protein
MWVFLHWWGLTVCRVGLMVLKIRTAFNDKYNIKMHIILKISL